MPTILVRGLAFEVERIPTRDMMMTNGEIDEWKPIRNAEIRMMREHGLPYAVIGDVYRMTAANVSSIVNGPRKRAEKAAYKAARAMG